MTLCCKHAFLFRNATNILDFSYKCQVNRLINKLYFSSHASNSIDMSYNVYNDFQPPSGQVKPPLIIMHGLFGSKTNWNSLSKALNKSTERTVYAVDARNHGISPHTDEFSYDLIANDIRRFVDSQSLDKINLMGHSMGGKASMCFSLRHPQLLEKLIIVDIAPHTVTSDMTRMINFFQIMRSVNVENSLKSAAGRKLAAEQMMKHIKSKLIVEFLLTNFVKTENGTFKWRLNLDSLEKNFQIISGFPETTAKFNNPSLFIAGERSDYLTRNDENYILNIFPQAKFVYLNTGHWVHAEDPAGLITAVSDFLKD